MTAPPLPQDPESAGARRKRLVWRFALAAAAFASSLVVTDRIFLNLRTGADENSYVFQAHLFSQGRIAHAPPPLPHAFVQEMIILNQRGWLSRYPPGHSLWLTPGIWLGGRIQIMIALAAAIGVWFTCAAAAALGIGEGWAGGVLLLSPFFQLMFGTHLSHTSGLAAAAILFWGYLEWRRSRRLWPAALAGLAWSFFLLNRTYTALLMALPFGCDALLQGARDRRARVWTGILLFATCATLGVAVFLAYNRATTGDALTATYAAYASDEDLGFGLRRSEGIPVLHTPRRGLFLLAQNLRRLDRWWLGFTGSLAVWLALGIVGRRRAPWGLLGGAVAAVPLGYIAFWYRGVTDAGGPAYYFETLVPLSLLGAAGAHAIRDRVAPVRAACLALRTVPAILATTSLALIAREIPSRLETQRVRRDLAQTIAQAPPRSLVFLERFRKPHRGEILLNPRGLDSDPLLMDSCFEDNVVAMRLFPDRRPFIIRGATPDRLEPLSPPDRLVIERGASRTARQTGRDSSDPADAESRSRIAEAGRDPAGLLMFGKYPHLPRGRYEVRFDAEWRDVSPERPLRFEVAADGGRRIMGDCVVSGSSTGRPVAFPIELTEPVLPVEPRVHFGGSGTVTLRRVSFTEQLP